MPGCDCSDRTAFESCGPLAAPIAIMGHLLWPRMQQPQEQAEWHGAIPAFNCRNVREGTQKLNANSNVQIQLLSTIFAVYHAGRDAADARMLNPARPSLDFRPAVSYTSR